MEIDILSEPELQFGVDKHVDIRFGIMNNFVFDFNSPIAPKNIKVGIVGTNETIEGSRKWLERCKSEIPAKYSNQPNLFPKFPGFCLEEAFQSSLILDSRLERAIPNHVIESIMDQRNLNKSIEDLVNLFFENIEYLSEISDVVICALPEVMIDFFLQQIPENEAGEVNKLDDLENEEDENPKKVEKNTNLYKIDFHDMLKAKGMAVNIPIQILLPSTYDESKRRKKSKNTSILRSNQDEATRAWNLHTAIYYKAKGIPWRLVKNPSDFTTCYIGIAFYKTLDQMKLLTSIAQVFDERGEGIIVRGGMAKLSKDDRQVHLSANDAFDLMSSGINQYKKEHGNYPARIVVHKSSIHNEEEKDGFMQAVQSFNIDRVDLISIRPSLTRLFRTGAYPPLRGTLLNLDNRNSILYSHGSVNFFATYPGLYVPRSLHLQFDKKEQTQRFLAQEILALTKMNWNNTQFDGREPITLRAAYQVSGILKYIGLNDPIIPNYRYYM